MSAVYKSIAAVQGELAAKGISKDSENSFDRYKFRGIDAVYNALSPLLSKHGLCVLPRIIERDLQERVSRKGEPMFYVTVTAEFDFVSAEDGSCHTVRTYGEAMDRSDKATNKAMSAAYKYAAFMAFAIPTEGDNDADASTPEIGAARGGQSEGTVSRPANDTAKKREKLDGPYTSKTALWNAVRAFTHNLHGCGDSDMFEAFLADKDSVALLAQCERDAPQLLDGGEGLPEDYVPINQLIKRMRADFELIENSALRAG